MAKKFSGNGKATGSLRIVRQFFPTVTKVTDATEASVIEVTDCQGCSFKGGKRSRSLRDGGSVQA